jgi:hypothetical protein
MCKYTSYNDVVTEKVPDVVPKALALLAVQGETRDMAYSKCHGHPCEDTTGTARHNAPPAREDPGTSV